MLFTLRCYGRKWEEGPVPTSSAEKGRRAQGFPSGAHKLRCGLCLVTIHQTSQGGSYPEIKIYI